VGGGRQFEPKRQERGNRFSGRGKKTIAAKKGGKLSWELRLMLKVRCLKNGPSRRKGEKTTTTKPFARFRDHCGEYAGSSGEEKRTTGKTPLRWATPQEKKSTSHEAAEHFSA